MTRAGEEIDRQGFERERNMAGRLGRIQQHGDACLAGDGRQLVDRLQGAGHIGGVSDGDEPRCWSERLLKGVEINVA